MESIYIALTKTLLFAWCFVDLDVFGNIIQERILIIKQCNESSTIRNLIKQLPLSLLTMNQKLDIARNLQAKNMSELDKELYLQILLDDNLSKKEQILIRIQIAKIEYPDRKEFDKICKQIEEFKDYSVRIDYGELLIHYGSYSQALNLYQNLFEEHYRNSHVASRVIYLLSKIENKNSIQLENKLKKYLKYI